MVFLKCKVIVRNLKLCNLIIRKYTFPKNIRNIPMFLDLIINHMVVWCHLIINIQFPYIYWLHSYHICMVHCGVWYDCIWVHMWGAFGIFVLILEFLLSAFTLYALVSFAVYRRIQLKSHLATAGKCSMDWRGPPRGVSIGGSRMGASSGAARTAMWGICSRHAQHASSASHLLDSLESPDSRCPIPIQIRFPFPSWGLSRQAPIAIEAK